MRTSNQPNTQADPQIDDIGLPPSAPPAEMDLKGLALSQDYTSLAPVKKTILKVPIQKPSAQTWFQISPEPAWQIQVPVIELKQDREHYIVARDMRDELDGEWIPKLLAGVVTKQGTVMFWPIRLPGPDGKLDAWNASALEIVRSFADRWIRVRSNMESGSYEAIEPVSKFPPPEWPADPQAMFKIAFRGRVITSADHPVVRQLRGGA